MTICEFKVSFIVIGPIDLANRRDISLFTTHILSRYITNYYSLFLERLRFYVFFFQMLFV